MINDHNSFKVAIISFFLLFLFLLRHQVSGLSYFFFGILVSMAPFNITKNKKSFLKNHCKLKKKILLLDDNNSFNIIMINNKF